MSFSALPAVLAQTLMHFLQPNEIISMARCSKGTMQWADAAFAWRHCPPVCVQCNLIAAVPPVCRFLRHMQISIVSADWLVDADVPRIVSFASSCCVVSLSFPEWDSSIGLDVAHQLLTAPSMQSLQDIGSVGWMSESVVKLTASLPELTSITIAPACPGMDNGCDPNAPLPLMHVPKLRSMFLSDSCQTEDGCMPAVMRLTQLRSFGVYDPKLHARTFVPFCSAMYRLESLTLQSWDSRLVRSISAAALATGFAMLICLHTLNFANDFDAVTLAPALHRLPKLRRLVVTTCDPFDDPQPMVELMHAAPLLHLELHCLSMQLLPCTPNVRQLLLERFDRVIVSARPFPPSSGHVEQ